MAATIGKIPLRLSIRAVVADHEPIEVVTGSLEVEVVGSYAVVKADDRKGVTVAATVDQPAARKELAQALRNLADQVEGIDEG